MEYKSKKNIIDELKCIWMSANFADEKLCNNNFDCDTCSFDKEMRKSKHRRELSDSIYLYSEQNILDDVIHKLNKLKSFTYPPQYYFNKCFVLKKFLGDTYFLGFNPMLNVLLDNVTASDIYPSQVYKKDDKFIKIQGEWGSLDIFAPFSFSMESEVLPLSLKPESGKWLGFIKSGNGNFDIMKTGKEDFIKSIDSVCSNLRKCIKKYVTVGATMYDGGERLKYIYQIIGKENYIKILLQILS
ncbi:MAG: hypothetical protein NTU73_11545 [Ignavibacteriae bacterium]|nr:hypothetical protein [Ignavibacteriota bacterium]